MKKKWLRLFWFIPPIIIALIILVVVPQMKRPPQKAEAVERPTKVRIIKAPSLPIVPRAVGYGTTEASRTWEAVAEVAGQVFWISDDLKSGQLIKQGAELLRIDDSSYKLALVQAETQLKALEVKDKTTQASLALEQRSQALLKKDIERKRKLRQQGTLSASVFEEAERSLLKGEVLVQNLKNTLALNAAEREVLKIQRANAELDLQRTVFVAPFDMRITDRKVSQSQYANKGQMLFTADGLEAVEIEARFPIGKLRPLIAGKKPAEDAAEGTAVDRSPGALKLEVVVRLVTATHTIEWPARVDRVAGVVDSQTQTLGVIVVVDEPYEQARPGQRPPLVRNTFVEVELRKKPNGKPVVIPVSALHEGKVYLLDSEDRLEIRPVNTNFIQGGAAAISEGVDEGESLVVSDLVPATVGMLLDPIVDEKVMKQLRVEATGQKGDKK
ncbi:MAG: efflux RND transporter periplasmic adaptor subunit [Gammaproteobacteria bacterium]|nr:efflux RND transporter periplasmic adaptor subunit [Gammaproteobacteria bacterium]